MLVSELPGLVTEARNDLLNLLPFLFAGSVHWTCGVRFHRLEFDSGSRGSSEPWKRHARTNLDSAHQRWHSVSGQGLDESVQLAHFLSRIFDSLLISYLVPQQLFLRDFHCQPARKFSLAMPF